MKNLIRNFVANYIRNHMAHEYEIDRDAIFQALNEGLRSAFYEDNIYSRITYTLRQVVENDAEFNKFRYQLATGLPKAVSNEIIDACKRS